MRHLILSVIFIVLAFYCMITGKPDISFWSCFVISNVWSATWVLNKGNPK